MKDILGDLLARLMAVGAVCLLVWLMYNNFGLSSGYVDGNEPPRFEPMESSRTDPPAEFVDPPELETTSRRCEDVTTFDNNWMNDMRCVREDGSVFFTDYDGAARFEAGE